MPQIVAPNSHHKSCVSDPDKRQGCVSCELKVFQIKIRSQGGSPGKSLVSRLVEAGAAFPDDVSRPLQNSGTSRVSALGRAEAAKLF